MTNCMSSILRYALIFSTAVLILGCRHEQKTDPLAVAPTIEPVIVTTDFTSRAIKTTGGLEAWKKAKKLEFDAIVTFYKPDDTFYLTEVRCAVYPWSNAAKISAVESQGELVWVLSGHRLELEKPAMEPNAPMMPKMPYDVRDMIYAVRDLMIAPVCLLNAQPEFTKQATPLKIEGLWYNPIVQTYPIEVEPIKPHWIKAVFLRARPIMPPKPYWSNAVFYQNRDNSLVDRLSLIALADDKFITVRGYDYYWTEGSTSPVLEKTKLSVPAKIEIFETDADGFVQRRTVKIDLREPSL